MSASISIQAAADFLREHDGYLILTHLRPDGDTVGCAAALCGQAVRVSRASTADAIKDRMRLVMASGGS